MIEALETKLGLRKGQKYELDTDGQLAVLKTQCELILIPIDSLTSNMFKTL